MGLSDEVLKVLPELGILTPTPIQTKTIPTLLEKSTDFIGLAQTGTGKTLAFGIPMIERMIDQKGVPQALVIAPTRELCQQITEQIKLYSKYRKDVTCEAVFGGSSVSGQIQLLKKSKPEIIVATPGRLRDFIRKRVVNLASIKLVVLDEADEMLNMGFKEEIDDILINVKGENNIWLFSATMPKEIRRIVNTYMEDPVEVTVNSGNKVNENILHQFTIVEGRDKCEALKRILDLNPEMTGIVFCRTKRDTQEQADFLNSTGYPVEALHGDLSQVQRDRVMKKLRSGNINLIIATDVAARGIDVDDLTHIIHFSLPEDITNYTHRSGRTARAGKKGISLAIISGRDKQRLFRIEKDSGIRFEQIMVPTLEEISSERLNRWVEQIRHVKPSKSIEEQFEEMQKRLSGLTAEDLLKKMLTLKFKDEEQKAAKNDINSGKKDRKDRKEKDVWGRKEERRDRGDRKDKRDRIRTKDSFQDRDKKRDKDSKFDKKKSGKPERSEGGKGDVHRYFINVGSMDKLSKKDLIELISTYGGVSKKDISVVDYSRKHSYFEVPKDVSKKMSGKFNDIEIEDRKIRVNRDN